MKIMGDLPVTRYTGEIYDNNVAVISPVLATVHAVADGRSQDVHRPDANRTRTAERDAAMRDLVAAGSVNEYLVCTESALRPD